MSALFRIFIVVAIFVFASIANAEDAEMPTLLGIEWDETFDEVAGRLPEFKREGKGGLFNAKSAGINDAAYGIVVASPHGELELVGVYGKSNTDPRGTQITKRMEALRDSIEKKYGKPLASKNHISRGYDGDRFLMGFMVNRSVYGYYWEVDGIRISLAINYDRSSHGLSYVLGYSHLARAEEKKAKQKAREDELL